MEMVLAITLILHLLQSILAKPIINSDVTIFFKAASVTKVLEIKQFDHTDSLYKVKNVKESSTWDYAVVAKGFVTEEARDAYVSKIKTLTFINETEVITMKAEPPSKKDYANYIMKITRTLNKIFSFLPRRPLKKLKPQKVKCEPVNMTSDEPMYLLSYKQPRDEAARKEYDWKMVSRALPVLKMEFLYSGFPDSKKWSTFDIHKYDSTRTYCEYVESKHIVRYKAKFDKAYADSNIFTAMKI